MTEKIRVDSDFNSPPRPIIFLAALLVYFFAYLLVRINFGGSLERDEAEIVHITQHLQLGYGTQPPLYAWLQWLVFSLFGLSRFSLAVLKDLILVGMYVGMYRTARPLLGVPAALATAASLVLFPQIGWESLRDLTHSVLLTSLACATLWCYFALLNKQNASRYALLGLLIGLGMQTKYNFGIFVAGLICASLLVREHRSLLWNRKSLLAVAVAIIVFLPHGIWLIQHIDEAATGTLRKLAEGTESAGYLNNVATGLKSVVVAAIAFAALPAVIYAASLWSFRKKAMPSFRSTESRFFWCLYGSFFAMLMVVILTGEVGKIKDRWMMPLLFSLPLAAFVIVPTFRQPAVVRNIQRIAVAFALIVLTALPLRIYVGPMLGKVAPPHHPYPELARELEKRFPATTTVIADGTLMAGNLRFERPVLQTVLLQDALTRTERVYGKVLFVVSDNARHDWLARVGAAYPAGLILEQGKIGLPYRFGGRGSMAFDYVHIDLQNSPH